MVPIVFLSVTGSGRDPASLAQRGPPLVVACLRGEHDLSTVAELSAALAQAMAFGDTDLVVDLSRVELLTAATIGVLRRAQDLLALRSRSLVVHAPSARARRVLEVSALGDVRELLDPGQVDTRLTEAAGALVRWVAPPVFEKIDDSSDRDRPVQLAMPDRAPEIVLIESTSSELAS